LVATECKNSVSTIESRWKNYHTTQSWTHFENELFLSAETPPPSTGKLVNSIPDDRKNLAILACDFNGDGVPSTTNTGNAPNYKIKHYIIIKHHLDCSIPTCEAPILQKLPNIVYDMYPIVLSWWYQLNTKGPKCKRNNNLDCHHQTPLHSNTTATINTSIWIHSQT
jgi:hypothetical protein